MLLPLNTVISFVLFGVYLTTKSTAVLGFRCGQHKNIIGRIKFRSLFEENNLRSTVSLSQNHIPRAFTPSKFLDAVLADKLLYFHFPAEEEVLYQYRVKK